MNTILITSIILGAIAFISGLVLFFASKKFAVIENPLIDEVEELLPGANCGGCGFAGCRAFAESYVNTKNTALLCPVASGEVMAAIAIKLGLEMIESQRMVARVICQGGNHCKREGAYLGIKSCSAAVIAGTENLLCPYGCLGYGDCLTACPFGCIQIVNGLAVINEDTCTGCGICIKSCPKHIIKLTPYEKRVYVACSSPDKGADVKQYCSVGCIGCKLCDKACEYSAIEYKPFLAAVNTDNCTECMACVSKCPTKAILFREGAMAIVANSETQLETVAQG